MTLQELATTTLSVNNLVALSDTALADFMKKNRRLNGHFELPVDGWDKLSKDERASLAERLLAQERALAQSPTALSRTLDLDQLDARLREISSSDKNSSSQAQRRWFYNGNSRPPTPFVDAEATAREAETDAYNNLVQDGGRPLYSIALLDEVSRKPEEYSDLLWPWLDPFGKTGRHWRSNDTVYYDWGVFVKQWARWQDFRTWQRDNRWLEDDDGGFPAYAEWYKNETKKDFVEHAVASELAELEADPSIIERAWKNKLWNRREQQRFCREHHRGVHFTDYVNAVKHRLASHGFIQPFYLKEDFKQQDDLATWIEYLCFEYWWLDRYTCIIDRLKPDYDKAWQKLVDKNVLRPHETQEFIRTTKSGMQTQADRNRARETVQRAQIKARQVYTSTQLDPNRLSIPKSERIKRLEEAIHKLMRAKARLKSVNERGDLIVEFVRSTFDFAFAKKDAARHRILLSWILAQVPLIEAKLNSTGAREDGSNQTDRTKRKIHTDDDDSQHRSPKKRKLDRSEFGLRSDQNTAVITKEKIQQQVSLMTNEKGSWSHNQTQRLQATKPPTKHPPRVVRVHEATPQGLRRSARVAARLENLETVLALQTFRKKLRPKRQKKPVQSSKSLSV